jgi:hypothetical protein
VQEQFDKEDLNNEVFRCLLGILGVESGLLGDKLSWSLDVFLKHAFGREEHKEYF